jgi:hypothetical protein
MIDFCAIDGSSHGSQQAAAANGVVTPGGSDTSQPNTVEQNGQAESPGPKDGKCPPREQAVRDQTINFNFPLLVRIFFGPIWWFVPSRLRLKFWAKLAWVVRWITREYTQDEFAGYFNKNADSFGKGLRGHLPYHLKRRLEGFIDDGGEPFLIVRGIFSRRFPQASLAKALEDDPQHPSRKKVGDAAKALMEKGCYNLIASALVAATGTKLRPKLQDDPVYHDLITETAAEISQFDDGTDMPLRYRTATPEKSPMAKDEREAAARILLFACIENPIADPIYLVRADEVVEKLSEDQRRLLHEEAFDFFDKWNRRKIAHDESKPNKRILYGGPTPSEYWLSFDPNRLAPKRGDATADHNAAVGALVRSIQKVVEEKKARKIVLRRGDALIVDNYRALTRRQEHGYAYFVQTAVWRPWMRMRLRPPIRWLRVYYGFPK